MSPQSICKTFSGCLQMIDTEMLNFDGRCFCFHHLSRTAQGHTWNTALFPLQVKRHFMSQCCLTMRLKMSGGDWLILVPWTNISASTSKGSCCKGNTFMFNVWRLCCTWAPPVELRCTNTLTYLTNMSAPFTWLQEGKSLIWAVSLRDGLTFVANDFGIIHWVVLKGR